jgi:DNA-binding LacI/PurR family transcriptional regulator
MAKYTEVFEALQRDILQGKYGEGRRLPSEAELVRRHKVSRPTAARALRELQQMGVIVRRAGSGSFLRPASASARNTTGKRFGLLVPGLGNTEILDPICNEITRYAQSLQCEVLWGEANRSAETTADADALCAQYIARGVDAVFFAPIEKADAREACNARILAELSAAGIPLVLLDRDATEFPHRSDYDLVCLDNITAGMELTAHLLARGARRICFLSRPHFPSTTELRRMGCEEALRRAGLALVASAAAEPDDHKSIKALLKDARPDAIVCANDQTAGVLMQTLNALGVRVPDKLRIAGFDDVRYATLLTVPLTTMHQPCRELGRAAVDTLLARLAHPELPPRQVLLHAPLMERASTA